MDWGTNEDSNKGTYSDEIQPIPAGTEVLAAPDEAVWKLSKKGDEYISIRWNVLSPAQYKGRKVFMMLFIDHSSETFRNTSRGFLRAIDGNAGGHLSAAGGKPTNESMAKHLVNSQMVLQLQVEEYQGNKSNKVKRIAPKNSAKSPAGAQNQPAVEQQTQAEKPSFDDIPF